MEFNGQFNTQDGRGGNVFSEQDRLNTFQNWPPSAAVKPADLAKAGFYYLGQGDRVRCAFCAGTLKDWKRGDDPLTEHKKHFGNCRFIKGECGNVNIPLRAGERRQQPSPQTQPHAVAGKGEEVCVGGSVRLNPRHPDYQSVSGRTASFTGWPALAVIQPPQLAEAGFFYCGYVDSVRCFCCDGHLRNWEPNDDPWVEHARWFPRCPYLLQQRGSTFINEVLLQRGASASLLPLGSQSEVLSDVQLKSTVVAKQVLDMGFDPDTVVSVLRRHMSTSGNWLPTLDVLLGQLVGDNSAVQPGTGGNTATPTGPQSTAGWLPSSEPASARGERPEEEGSERIICKVCMDREVSVTFLPCGHLVCCAECAKHVQQCPVCRQNVRASIRTYLC